MPSMHESPVLVRHIASERLLWVAGGQGNKEDAQIRNFIDNANHTIGETLCMETLESASCLQLRVPFFSSQQLGKAAEYGPLGIDVVLDFCQELNNALNKTSTAANVALYCSNRHGAVLNSLLLIGSFLILERELCTADVLHLIMPEHRPDQMEWTFPRPWCSKQAWSKDALSLQECLHGLEVAVAKHWLHRKSLDGSSRRKIRAAYDAMPFFTFKLLRDSVDGVRYEDNITFWVAADPVTTVIDPSQQPCASDTSETNSRSSSLCSRNSSSSSIFKFASKASFFKSVAKPTDPNKDISVVNDPDRPQHLKDFADWLKNDLGCVMLVRTNFTDEPNLPLGGSYEDFFDHQGIQQVDLPFTDGTSPPDKVVESLLAEVGLLLDRLKMKTTQKPCNYAVMVHCKSGLGRSMCLLCMLAVALFPDIGATDIFGWARLARPGAIQTAAQERYMRSLDEEEKAGTSCCWQPEIKSGLSVRDLFHSEHSLHSH